jgi:sugar-specific transcriptional regulator TrmB
MLKELQNFGLSEKEAKVYVALLALQQSSVQEISRRSGVNRATTYVQLETLRSRGLVAQTSHGKKMLFVPEPPENVSRLIEQAKVDVINKEKEFNKILPDLKSLFKEMRSRPNVRFYEGKEGLRAYREELFRSPHQTIAAIFGLNTRMQIQDTASFRKQIKKHYQQFSDARIIYVDKHRDPLFDSFTNILPQLEIRFVPLARFPIEDVEIDIFDKKTFIIGTDKANPRGVAVDDDVLCAAFQAMFDMIWSSSQK